MKKAAKIIGVFTYIATAILVIISIITEYNSVSENLDGMHGFKSSHALIFALLCIIIIAGCVYNAFSLYKSTTNIITAAISLALVVISIAIFICAITLPGNVETDMQYLTLRISQGFETTGIFLIITTIIGLIVSLIQKFAAKK